MTNWKRFESKSVNQNSWSPGWNLDGSHTNKTLHRFCYTNMFRREITTTTDLSTFTSLQYEGELHKSIWGM